MSRRVPLTSEQSCRTLNAGNAFGPICAIRRNDCFYSDPLFTNGWRLGLPGEGQLSPIDKGHNWSSDPCYCDVPPKDPGGQPRPVPIEEVPDGSGGCTDMGAYETQE